MIVPNPPILDSGPNKYYSQVTSFSFINKMGTKPEIHAHMLPNDLSFCLHTSRLL